MPLVLLFLFILVPILEVTVFMLVGGLIGLWLTLTVIIATAALGATLIRHKGLEILKQAQSSFAAGHMPVREITDGICLFMAGALLLIPGFISDFIGGLFLIPFFCNLIQTAVLEKFFYRKKFRLNGDTPWRHTSNSPMDPEVLEGSFTVYPDNKDLGNEPKMNNGDTDHEDNVSSRWGCK